MGATSPHFSDAELRCHGTDCGPGGKVGCLRNRCTAILVNALEAFRVKAAAKWNAKYGPMNPFPGVDVHDAYRCPIHNGETSGAAANSQHPAGRAADISVDGLTADELEAIANTIPTIKGIGRDPIRNFIHVDVRPQTKISRWCYYRVKGKMVWGAWYAPGTKPGPVNA
jgi:hypothetical protein